MSFYVPVMIVRGHNVLPLFVCLYFRPLVPSKKGLYDHLIPQILSNQSEFLHNCYKHIEDVHLPFDEKKIFLKKKYGLYKLRKMFDFWLIQDDKFIQ